MRSATLPNRLWPRKAKGPKARVKMAGSQGKARGKEKTALVRLVLPLANQMEGAPAQAGAVLVALSFFPRISVPRSAGSGWKARAGLMLSIVVVGILRTFQRSGRLPLLRQLMHQQLKRQIARLKLVRPTPR